MLRGAFFWENDMAQREHIAELEVGDFIQLPRGEWHENPEAKAMYAQAQQVMTDHQGPGPAPQYQVQYQDKFASILERIK